MFSNNNMQRLWLMIGFVIIAFFFVLFMLPDASSTSRSDVVQSGGFNIMLCLLLLAILVIRLHPRFAGINAQYQRSYDSIVLIAFLSTFIIISPSIGLDLPKTLRDGLLAAWIAVPICFYGLNYLILPEVFRLKSYQAYHFVVGLLQILVPRNANLYLARAQAYHQQFESERVVETVNRAIDLIPRTKAQPPSWLPPQLIDTRLTAAYQLRMQAYFALAQHEQALEDVEALIRLQPHEPVYFMNRSMALRNLGDFVAAEADLDMAVRLQSKPTPIQRAFASYSRAHLIGLQDRPQEALNLYRYALKIALPDDQVKNFHSEVYFQIGMLELKSGEDAEAEKAFKAIEDLAPDAVHIGVVALHAKRGEWDEALRLWQRAILQRPSLEHLDILRRHYHDNPLFMDLIEQVVAYQSNQPVPSHPLYGV